MLSVFKNLFGKSEAPVAPSAVSADVATSKRAVPEWYETFLAFESFEPQTPLFERPEREQWLEFMSDADIMARPLVPPASSSFNLFVKITDENTTPKEAAQLAADDPILTARILKSVNSAYFGLRVPVNDVHTAVNLLGLDQLKILIMSQAVESQVRPDSGLEAIALHSAIVGQIAGQLALRHKLSISTMTTLGVLHDMGRLLRPYVQQTNSHFLSIHPEIQHGLLGGAFSRIWNLPHSLANVLENLPFASFGHSADIASDHTKEIQLLAVAEFLANAFGFGDGSEIQIPQEAIKELGLDPDPRKWLTDRNIDDLQKTALLF